MESDSDDDLAEYPPSGLSHADHVSEAVPKVTKEQDCDVKKQETLSKEADDTMRRARHFVAKLSVPDEIQSLDQLAWHKYKRKNSKHHLNPVRIGSKDMIIGLNLPQNFDESKKNAIEYLSCRKQFIGKRNVVPRSQLLPYGSSNQWNPLLMTEYLNALVGQGGLTELERCKEELYLLKVLDVVNKRESERVGAIKEESLPLLAPSDLVVETDLGANITFPPLQNDSIHIKEPLQAGDVIEYYRTFSKAGDKEALTQAVVLGVKPGQIPLKLHNDEVLPAAHSVRRIFARRRRGFVELKSTATFRSIRAFKLTRSELRDCDPLRQLLESANTQIDEIFERNFAELEKRVKDSGCGPLMSMISWKGKKRTSTAESVEIKIGKHSKQGPAIFVSDSPSSGLGLRNIESLKAQLKKIRSLSGRRREAASYMTEDMLELAIQVRKKLQHNEAAITLEDLAEELCLSEYALKQFLDGDQLKLIRLAQHEGTMHLLRQWVDERGIAPS